MTLLLPFELRSRQSRTLSREDYSVAWARAEGLLAALGLDIAHDFAAMRYGSGWHRLQSGTKQAIKERVLDALVRQVNSTGARYRAYRLILLLERYYRKADAAGRASRKQVITADVMRTLTGFFGGDWLGLLSYIGEEADASEKGDYDTAGNPLLCWWKAKGRQQLGLPATEVEAMAAAFWRQERAESPIEERITMLERYWRLFDEIHARQRTGMTNLWGLVEDVRTVRLDDTPWAPFNPDLYRRLLPPDLLADIEGLWGCTMLPQWPERIVSAPYRHISYSLKPSASPWSSGMGARSPPVLYVWSDVSYSVAGMAQYYRRQLQALADAGMPVPAALFDELTRVAIRLKLDPPQPMVTIAINPITGATDRKEPELRRGFEELRASSPAIVALGRKRTSPLTCASAGTANCVKQRDCIIRRCLSAESHPRSSNSAQARSHRPATGSGVM